MPDLSTLLLFMAAAGIVVAIPGPNHLYIITRSVSQGRSAGLASAAGIETGTLVHIAAAALGLSSIIASLGAGILGDQVRGCGLFDLPRTANTAAAAQTP